MHSEAQKVLVEFQKRIPESVAPHIRQMVLFGSASRGDDHQESDVDLLVLLETPSQQREERLREAAYQAMWASDFRRLLSLKILTFSAYQDRLLRGYSFYQKVEREGTLL